MVHGVFSMFFCCPVLLVIWKFSFSLFNNTVCYLRLHSINQKLKLACGTRHAVNIVLIESILQLNCNYIILELQIH